MRLMEVPLPKSEDAESLPPMVQVNAKQKQGWKGLSPLKRASYFFVVLGFLQSYPRILGKNTHGIIIISMAV